MLIARIVGQASNTCRGPGFMTFKTIFGRTAFLAAALTLFLTAASEAKAGCQDPAGPGVDWSNCDKSGADLIDVNLSGANLTNANLTNANLSGAITLSADLSGATWMDGQVCAEGSVMGCD